MRWPYRFSVVQNSKQNVINFQSNFQSDIIGYCCADLVTVSRCFLSKKWLQHPLLNIEATIASPVSLGSLTFDSVIVAIGNMCDPFWQSW